MGKRCSSRFYVWHWNIFICIGYHQCTRDEAAILAALIYRVKFGENKSELSNVTQMLRELVPTDLIKSSSAAGMKEVDLICKLDFLINF